MKYTYFYLIKLQYLGYRYHGWQKQPGIKTVEHMVERTVNFILKDQVFKILAAGRTDAMVSAEEAAIELFTQEPLESLETFIQLFNYNLPADIRAINIKEIDAKFNIIQTPKLKEYQYLFCFGEKYHPFCASLMTYIREEIDIDAMQTAAKLFEGTHYFGRYTRHAKAESQLIRNVASSEIIENTEITASFFPNTSYLFKVTGAGFMRHQVRIMMGALIEVGRGERSIEELKQSLIETSDLPAVTYTAPASGLRLKKIGIAD